MVDAGVQAKPGMVDCASQWREEEAEIAQRRLRAAREQSLLALAESPAAREEADRVFSAKLQQQLDDEARADQERSRRRKELIKQAQRPSPHTQLPTPDAGVPHRPSRNRDQQLLHSSSSRRMQNPQDVARLTKEQEAKRAAEQRQAWLRHQAKLHYEKRMQAPMLRDWD